MVWILEWLKICSLEFLPNECETAVVVTVIFKELSRAKVLMKPGKVSSSLLQELHGKQGEKGDPDLDLPGQTLIS